jgi:hypothetical protein
MRSAVMSAAVLLSLVLLLLGAGNADAAPDGPKIKIEPDRVESGARDVTLVFRMTDDDPAAPATDFQLFLPTGRPLVGVTASAPQGWAAELTTTELPAPAPTADGPVREIVSAVAWTATAPREPGVVEFALHVALMPEGAGPVRFRALCADVAGRTVEWTDSWAENGPKPAHDSLKLALGEPRPPVETVAHGDHQGGGATAAPPGRSVTPDGVAMTAGVLLAATGALTALLMMLSRNQRHRFERVSPGDRIGER